MTTITSHNPARDDARPASAPASGDAPVGRGWAFAGIGAGVLALAGGVCATLVDGVYRADLRGDEQGVAERIAEKLPVMTAFHVLMTIATLLLVVFGLGLYRRLRAADAEGLAPAVAAAGVLGTAVVVVLGVALNTEFIFAFGEPDLVNPANAAMYNHWIGTVPAVWVLTGLSGLAMFALSRRGAVPRWLGIVGLVFGGLTLLISIAPLQYMAGLLGQLWLIVTAAGLARRG